MKPNNSLLGAALILAVAAALATTAPAQTTVTTTDRGSAKVITTTTSGLGRLGTITPDLMVMESASGTEPIRYIRTTRTVFVDETGAIVPAETARVGVPVTIHYTKDGDRLVAERVVVQRRAGAPGRIIEKETTTTTTTTPVRVRDDDDDDDDDD